MYAKKDAHQAQALAAQLAPYVSLMLEANTQQEVAQVGALRRWGVRSRLDGRSSRPRLHIRVGQE